MTKIKELNNILDEDDGSSLSMKDNQGDDLNEVTTAHEHSLRVQAEAEARDASQKVSVLQQQFAEYAQEKAAVEKELCQYAEKLEAMCSQMLAGNDPGNVGSNLAEEMQKTAMKLKEELHSCAVEGTQTAAQVKQETERLKRTADDANLEVCAPSDPAKGEAVDASFYEEEGGIEDMEEDAVQEEANHHGKEYHHDLISERAKYIPLRLSHDERRLLRLLEAALNVSEYTDKVDILSYRSKNARVHAQIKDLCAILCGLVVAQNFRKGQKLVTDRNFSELENFFQSCFEIGRRHKVMNPEKMRDTYGKLMYMLMDSVEPEIQELLGFKCAKKLQTVYGMLEEGGALGLLKDPLISTAISEIKSEGRGRQAIQKDIRAKERARELLAKRYKTSELDEESLLLCMYSLSDNNAYLRFNRDPVDKMISYLKMYFAPDSVENGFSLAIQGGSQGSRLTHSHQRQFTYVLQTLTLWREIAHEMFKLWCMADEDMLAERNYYRLQNTGQGLQRVQSAPHVSRAMSNILGRCQRRIGSWVGSSVVHLGDHNVPNALMFIDKYTQVPRILNPIVLVLDEIPKVAKDLEISKYIDNTFGGVESCRKHILTDFFRHGFDGSGADNFFDAGSCIDGRT